MVQSDLYIGLMSGTSADALDAALIDFNQSTPSIVNTYSLSIPVQLKKHIYSLALPSHDEINQLRLLDREIALLSVEAIEKLCKSSGISLETITAIGSHGQTVRHYPPTEKEHGYTLQVGDPNIIAELTGITTVADFRRRDITVGGHGAPLAPAFHDAIFRSSEAHRAVINLGGIANISWLPQHAKTIGYDTGPANGLMDAWCQLHLKQPYDKNGEWALSGTLQTALLDTLLQHPFLSTPPPKSTGREDFNLEWLKRELNTHTTTFKPEDVQATLLELTAKTVADAIMTHDESAIAEIYICGGGAQNEALMKSLQKHLSPRTVSTTEALNIHSDWVECAAFAWMAYQTINHSSSNLPSVTGASKKVILGGIYPGAQK